MQTDVRVSLDYHGFYPILGAVLLLQGERLGSGSVMEMQLVPAFPNQIVLVLLGHGLKTGGDGVLLEVLVGYELAVVEGSLNVIDY